MARLVDGLADAVRALPSPWHGTFFEVVDSTQEEARSAAKQGAPSRSVFVADYQRAGRGRHGRTWIAPQGTALLVSILFRDRSPDPAPFRWTMLAAVALTETLAAYAEPAIKWPNDVLIGTRKVAGVLAESTWNGEEFVTIVGIGVNVSVPAADLIGFAATSVTAEAGIHVDRAGLLQKFVTRMDVWLARSVGDLRTAWQERLWRSPQRVRMVDLGREESVVVLGVESDGALRVRLENGTERTTTTAELIL